jgi:hypothetical protein
MTKTRARRSRRRFLVVVASDGSRPAREAVKAAADFPWPPDSEAMAVVARGEPLFDVSPSVTLAMDAGVRRGATDERQDP